MSTVQQAIIERHTHTDEIDEEQLEAIFSSESHLAVEAPAGHGKTRTMVSKIAYLIATAQVPYPKKILALTFSINAAFKIRRDVIQQLPSLLAISPSSSRVELQVVYATNYHGLCRRILGRYGYLTSPELHRADSLKGVGIGTYDSETYTKNKLKGDLQSWGIELAQNEIHTLIQYTKHIKLAGARTTRQDAIEHLSTNLKSYLRIVKDKFLPQGYILFDAILLFTRELFYTHPQIRDFYRRFFPIVIVDEFQDTNILQWALLQDIAGRADESPNQLFVFGDRHQKIYEFIGAMHDIVDEAKSHYGMQEIQLGTNHRFKDNLPLLRFDANIRRVAENPLAPQVDTVATIQVIRSANQDEEAQRILTQVKRLVEQDPDGTIAVLTRAGKDNNNTIRIVECFNREKAQGFSYFFALYSDEDEEYVDFHSRCLSCLYTNLAQCRNFRGLVRCVQEGMQAIAPSETWTSLQTLLETFLTYISQEFRFLSLEEKTDLVVDTLRNKALKQYLMHVANSQVTLSTVHGSKGLEWDYVILPDMERNSFPSYPGLCRTCNFGRDCQLDWTRITADSEFAQLFTQELNVFYVGGTRARKSVYFTYSDVGLNSGGNKRPNNRSCLLSLAGLQIGN